MGRPYTSFSSAGRAAACEAVLAVATVEDYTTRELVYALQRADPYISQSHLARLCGRSRERISQILNGRGQE